MSEEGDVQFHPDRGLAYARWVLSRDPASLNQSDREQLEFLRGEAGQGMLKIFEEWERDVKADERARPYPTYLMAAHTVCLRLFGRMLPQRFLLALWYVSWSVVLAGCAAALWWLVRFRAK